MTFRQSTRIWRRDTDYRECREANGIFNVRRHGNAVGLLCRGINRMTTHRGSLSD
ncbi:hypothetical protein RB213_001993 [Colletotrichum asianum]